jgi:hypothetical protein
VGVVAFFALIIFCQTNSQDFYRRFLLGPWAISTQMAFNFAPEASLNKGATQIQCNTAVELVQNHHLSQTVATTYPIHPLPSDTTYLL